MQIHKTIKELPGDERPYEKALRFGVSTLSDTELLAVILRSGTREKTSVELARDVMTHSEVYPGLMGLYHARQPDLQKIPGIGKVKSLQLLSIAELAKRMARMTRTESPCFRDAESLVQYLMEEMRCFETEHFYVVCLDASDRLLKVEDLFRGTVCESIVSPREVLRLALSYDAAALVIVHNHPSGDPTPSRADNLVTARFQSACEMVGIYLRDHIIIGDHAYVSYLESGFFEEDRIS